MGTVTKTYTENNWSTYQSTWTVTVTTADMVVSGDFVLSLPTVSAKYVYSSKKRGEVDITIAYGINGTLYRSTATYKRADGAMTSGTTYTISNTANSRPTVTLSDVFTENNKTTRTVNVNSSFGGNVFLGSSKTSDGEQRNSYSFPSISLGTMATVTLDVPPTATVSPVSFDTPYVYAGMTTASVTVADATAYYGGDIDSATLTIGNQTVSISGDGTLSILLNAGGTFTPVVTITDSRGQVQEYPLDPITVGIYSTPTVNFDAERTTNTGVLDDEGAYATIVTTLTFDPIAEAVAPTVAVADEDGITQTATTTWYSSRASDGTLSGAVTWSTLPSGSTVYGLISITGDFDTQKSYVISLTPTDSEGITGDVKTDTLQTAFYTVDFLAGGHGIAFGMPASQDGFFCNMPANFVDANDVMRALFDFVYPVGSYYETSDTTFDPNVTWGGTWVLGENGETNIIDSGWKTLVDTNGTIIYRKIGKTVFVDGYGLQITHNVIRATLPMGYRPDRRTTVAGAFPLTKQTYANIETNGTINPIINGGGTEANWFFQAVFSTGEGETSGTNRWHRTA